MKTGTRCICRTGYLHYRCPGCQREHAVEIGGLATPGFILAQNDSRPLGDRSHWWNGSLGHPTVLPNICFLGAGGAGQICHHAILDGFLHFKPDCTHALAGQTVEMPLFPGEEEP